MEPAEKKYLQKFLLALGILCLICAIILFLIWDDATLTRALFQLKKALAEGSELRESILAYGVLSPVIYVVLQILQVILAPVPGEATGLLGGYLFGVWPSFIYSTIALTIGSGIAFSIGHLFSNYLRRKYEKTKLYQRFNHLIFKGDFVIPFVLFLFPGFPKDSLSYLLGLSFMPFKVFLFIAGVARMPGTLMLSLQGAKVYEAEYIELLILVCVSLAISFPCYIYRKKILELLNAYNNLNSGHS
jgi:uncharacterized membrane protein YdjX (TVP38/TMEM64 family)